MSLDFTACLVSPKVSVLLWNWVWDPWLTKSSDFVVSNLRNQVMHCLFSFLNGSQQVSYPLFSANLAVVQESMIKAAIGISEGLRCLHSKRVIHGDLKPQNILLSQENVAKIADFGLSKISMSSGVSLNGKGTLAYMVYLCCFLLFFLQYHVFFLTPVTHL